jgi:hypothetical protein
MRATIWIVIWLCWLGESSWAQERCGTVEYEEKRHRQNPGLETIDQFEDWLKGKMSQQRTSQGANRTQSTTIIPVVVHVIHFGESIGTGRNISNAQIISQINVLNKDFQRLNADAGNTPSEFAAVAGVFDVEFVLAKQDPEGLPSSGILRAQGNRSSWSDDHNQELKALSYWPAENYLNIWVADLSDLLGYAQFPVSSLVGTNEGPKDRITDGVVIDYRAFGSIDDGAFTLDPQFNKGRTATHEVGHFFGLRHIWGDEGGCGGSDFVSDTPNQSSETRSCPVHPQSNSCSPVKMFQNYMDYTDDLCMNLFTAGQVSRMATVLSNSPRRVSLSSSPGASEPVLVANDLGIRTILSPKPTACPGSFVPSLEIRNYGTNPITSSQIQLRINSAIVETRNFSLSLAPQAIAVVNFNPADFTGTGDQTIAFEIQTTNGVSDGKVSNNLRELSVLVPVSVSLPVLESFTSIPGTWTIDNPDGLRTWQTVTTTGGLQSVYVNLYDYEDAGARDRLISPRIVLDQPSALLRFDRAYAKYSNSETDQLRVLVSTTCDFTNAVEVFNRSGDQLATAPQTTGTFIPTQTQWATETISLSSFIGQTIQLAFETVNDFGNNLYVDNIQLIGNDFIDVAIIGLERPSAVTCQPTLTAGLMIKNTGSLPVNKIEIQTQLNNGTTSVETYTNVGLDPGEQRTITLNNRNLISGDNTYRTTILEVDDAADEVSNNNTLIKTIVLNPAKDIIPLRETFENNNPDWTIVSQGNQPVWEFVSTNKGKSVSYQAFDFAGQSFQSNEAWLVSPVLDFSRLTHAGLFFDMSYANRPDKSDQLKILGSKDCGVTYSETPVYEAVGTELSEENSLTSWIPSDDADWKRKFIDLTPFVGEDQVRLSFVAINGNGNNIYLDNIEFYIENYLGKTPLVSSELAAIYDHLNGFRITFNLPERKDVRMQVFNTMGQVLIDNNLVETLNQTYDVDMTTQAKGIYIVRLQIGNSFVSRRLFID